MGSASSGVRRQHHHHEAVGGRISRPVPRPRTSAAVLAVAEAPPLVVPTWLERSVNLLLAILALLLLSPVLLLIALAGKLSSRGPVLYTQERVGPHRRGGTPRRHSPPAPARSRRPAVHHLQVPHDAGRCRARERRSLGGPERSPGHPAGPAAAPVPAGR